MLKKKKTTASGKLVLVKSVRRTRSHRMKFCVQRGLGALPSTSSLWQMDSHKHCLPVSKTTETALVPLRKTKRNLSIVR